MKLNEINMKISTCNRYSVHILKHICTNTQHFMVNRWGNNGNSDRLYFGGSKITADGDCNHEIKRHLLLGKTEREIKETIPFTIATKRIKYL